MARAVRIFAGRDTTLVVTIYTPTSVRKARASKAGKIRGRGAVDARTRDDDNATKILIWSRPPLNACHDNYDNGVRNTDRPTRPFTRLFIHPVGQGDLRARIRMLAAISRPKEIITILLFTALARLHHYYGRAPIINTNNNYQRPSGSAMISFGPARY